MNAVNEHNYFLKPKRPKIGTQLALVKIGTQLALEKIGTQLTTWVSFSPKNYIYFYF